MQFHWHASPRAAATYLRRALPMAENHGDRILAERRLDPVTTREERAAAIAYNERAVLERFRKVLSGEWPAHGPIVVRAKERT
jgi:hypothetical protein